ncbi:NAD(P)H-hydrate dehydratase [Pedobacter sp. SYSU D00535]|uniref:NAD(P)H-hydrate dehydratase n=1 Tax=Pedobacter sp. SYSU D00535 TaxID=2810308 RepID=UPI001A95EAB0|nr:NAD(P)H-hydrate dehydratase [Pedobacter sp. SYSU D00535]
MKNLLTAAQIRQVDEQTIHNEPIGSIDLMERASAAFVKVFCSRYPDTDAAISIYCGTGNNGGDGLAIARLLQRQRFSNLNVKIARFSSRTTADFDENYHRLQAAGIPILELTEDDTLPVENSPIIIDALLGSGLNKELGGAWKELVIWLRSLNRTVVAVDVPTGLRSDGTIGEKDVAISADLVITFQRPKINFLLPESERFVKQFEVVDIGLDEAFIQSLDTPYAIFTDDDCKSRLKTRSSFSHKGTFGHSLVVAGSAETMGAALLSAEACLHAGSGLTTACIPAEGLTALNVRVPEVMAAIRMNGMLPEDLDLQKYDALGVGPGLGTNSQSKSLFERLLKEYQGPVVLDADALNLLSYNYELMALLPEGAVLTPHVKEFDRLFGKHETWWERLQTGIDRATTLRCTIVLKNRYTIVFTPEGRCIFNLSGSPAMATGGMGDVLTGIITAFLAQGYSPEDAALLGVFLHGKTGEDLATTMGVTPAALVATSIGKTIKKYSRS